MSKENIQGFESKKEAAKVVDVTQDSWAVSDEDLNLVKMRLEIEQRMMMDVALFQIRLTEATERARSARKDREQFCVDLEKRLSVPAGTVWVVDFEKKALVKRQ